MQRACESTVVRGAQNQVPCQECWVVQKKKTFSTQTQHTQVPCFFFIFWGVMSHPDVVVVWRASKYNSPFWISRKRGEKKEVACDISVLPQSFLILNIWSRVYQCIFAPFSLGGICKILDSVKFHSITHQDSNCQWVDPFRIKTCTGTGAPRQAFLLVSKLSRCKFAASFVGREWTSDKPKCLVNYNDSAKPDTREPCSVS